MNMPVATANSTQTNLTKTNLTKTNLTKTATQFSNSSQQIKALQWFQTSTGTDKQKQFARLWRDNSDDSAIDFVRVFRYYEQMPHQNIALRWLEQNSQERTLVEFDRLWHLEPPVKQAVKRSVQLAVPFFPQTDNFMLPDATCNSSACAMAAKFLGAKLTSDDEYLERVLRLGASTSHFVQTQVLEDYGIRSSWHQNLDYDDLYASLNQGKPVVLGILHRGTHENPDPEKGHVIVAIGYKESGNLICHDPYGSLLDPWGGYTGDVGNGRAVEYPRWVLNHRWLVGGARSGWGRLFK